MPAEQPLNSRSSSFVITEMFRRATQLAVRRPRAAAIATGWAAGAAKPTLLHEEGQRKLLVERNNMQAEKKGLVEK
jgi:hypothetical protein